MLDIEIRPIVDSADNARVVAIQNTSAAEPAPPPDYMHAAREDGALFTGAYVGDTLIGYAFGSIGLVPGERRVDLIAAARLKLALNQVAVHPDYQGRGVGTQLMIAALVYANRLGLRLITFAADPLHSVHGWLFIGKLGGVGTSLAGDRIGVDWWITNNRVKKRTTNPRKPLKLSAFVGAGAVVVSSVQRDTHGTPTPPDKFVNSSGNVVLVEIPAQINEVADEAETLWRQHLHILLDHYLSRGYLITDFVREPGADGTRSFLVLMYRDA